MKSAALSFFVLALAGFLFPAIAGEKVSVAELHEKRAALSGKEVTLVGEVIKVNNGIMRRNFIHVQDGTGSGDLNRVILTSRQTARVGDKIEATGTVKLDTNFGAGYFYPTLVEQTTIAPAQ